MEKMSAQSLRMSVVNLAMSDPAYRNELIKDKAKAVTARFGDQPFKVRVETEGEKEFAILIPQKTDQLSKALDRIVRELGDRSPTRSEFDVLVVHRAWTDPAFLTKLRSNPRAAVTEELGKYNANLPQDATVRFYEEQPGECLIVVPPAADKAELSKEELELVAGGNIALIAGAVVGAIAGKVVDKIWPVAMV